METQKNFNVSNMLSHTLKYGGGTFNVADGEPVEFKKGFQVSIKDIKKLDLTTATAKQIEKGFMRAFYSAEALGCGYVGTWIDNNILYIDISIRINKLDDAITAGRDNKQLAIYDWAKLDSIYID